MHQDLRADGGRRRFERNHGAKVGVGKAGLDGFQLLDCLTDEGDSHQALASKSAAIIQLQRMFETSFIVRNRPSTDRGTFKQFNDSSRRNRTSLLGFPGIDRLWVTSSFQAASPVVCLLRQPEIEGGSGPTAGKAMICYQKVDWRGRQKCHCGP
jgi:hypothetical protein